MASVVLALTACSGPPFWADGGGLDPLDPVAASTAPPTSTPTAEPPPPPLPARVDRKAVAPAISDASRAVLQSRLAAMKVGDASIAVRWATLPGENPLNALLVSRARAAADAFAASLGAAWAPGVDVAPGGTGAPCPRIEPAPRTVGCELVLAHGDLVGVRTLTEPVEPEPVTRTAIYADAAGTVIGDGAALIDPSRRAYALMLVARAIVDAEKTPGPPIGKVPPGSRPTATSAAPTPLPEPAPTAPTGPFVAVLPENRGVLLADAVVLASGDLLVHAPTAPGADGRGTRAVPVVIDAEADILSDLGERIVAALDADTVLTPQTAGLTAVDCGFVACVALTFDDGPTGLTDGLLDTLGAANVRATFYLQGGYVENRPATVLRTAQLGHELGNHTWAHPALTTLPDPDVVDQIARTQAAIAAASGVVPTTMRPPYGDYDDRIVALVGMPLVTWDIDTKDWADPGRALLVERAVGGPERGSIVLMHDTHESTVAAVPEIIAGLRGRGFDFASVSGLFGGAVPGGRVTHGPR